MSVVDDSGPELGGDDLLAAEYVLGVLAADARAAATRRIEEDRAFAAAVDRWESVLAPIATRYRAVEPPAGVKAAVDRRLFATAAMSPASAQTSFWSSLAFWRGLTVAALAGLAIAIAVPLLAPPPPQQQAEPARLVASLAPKQSDVHYFVVYDARQGDIGLSHVTGARADSRDFELWVIEGQQTPVSLGVIPSGQTVHIPVNDELRRKIAAGATFAITLEPLGGSATGGPTGPVVAAGALHSI